MTIVMDQVMAKVRTVFILRRLAAPFVFSVVAAAVLASTVSVSHVIANMPAVFDIPAVVQFYTSAFAHTGVVVQSALVAGILFLLMTLKGAVDSFRLSSKLSASLSRV